MKRRILALVLILCFTISNMEIAFAFADIPVDMTTTEHEEFIESQETEEGEGVTDSTEIEEPTDTDGLVYENNSLFYYENGIRFVPDTAGFYEFEGGRYYVYADGSVFQAETAGVYMLENQQAYYFTNDHQVLTFVNTGFQKINDKWYYIETPETVYYPETGKHMIDGIYYFFEEDGSVVINDWKTFEGETGYYTIKGPKKGRCKIDGYYYYFTSEGVLITSKDAKRTSLKHNGKLMEIRSLAKQKVYGYDTLQGSCTDGTYAYYVLYNRNVEKCKIVKMDLSDNHVVKVSKVLKISHGNGLTYNPKNHTLVAVHNTVHPTRLTVINADTLRIKKHIDVKIPETLEGATAKQIKKIKKFGGISYNESRNIYVVLLSTSHDLLILDEKFKPVSYTTLDTKPKYIYQCIDVSDTYIMIGMSPRTSDQQNIISIYEWDGTYRFQINVKQSYELESVFHIGKDIYTGFYRSYIRPYTLIIKKTKKVKGKKVVTITKKSCTELLRSNYVYKLRDYRWKIT